MSNNTRRSANLVSESNIFSDINNNTVGIGTTVAPSKLTVQGDVLVSGSLVSGSVVIQEVNSNFLSFNYLTINTDKTDPQYGQLSVTKFAEPDTTTIDISALDVFADYVGIGSFYVNDTGSLVFTL